MLHCLNTCKICQKYWFIMTPHKSEVGPTACKAAPYCGIHQVNQPFIMYAGSWRAGITLIFRALYCANETEGTGQLHRSSDLVWCHYFLSAILNHIFFYRCYKFDSTCIHRHNQHWLWTLSKCWTVRWEAVTKLDWYTTTAVIIMYKNMAKT